MVVVIISSHHNIWVNLQRNNLVLYIKDQEELSCLECSESARSASSASISGSEEADDVEMNDLVFEMVFKMLQHKAEETVRTPRPKSASQPIQICGHHILKGTEAQSL